MKLLKKIFKEQNLVVILFVIVLAVYAYVQNETKKMDNTLLGSKLKSASPVVSAEKIKSLKSNAVNNQATIDN